jgi:hypothetical protein
MAARLFYVPVNEMVRCDGGIDEPITESRPTMDRGVEVGAEALKVGNLEDIRRLQYPGRAFIPSDEGQPL